MAGEQIVLSAPAAIIGLIVIETVSEQEVAVLVKTNSYFPTVFIPVTIPVVASINAAGSAGEVIVFHASASVPVLASGKSKVVVPLQIVTF